MQCPIVTLRPVSPCDLDLFFANESDAEASKMAVARPRSRDAFDAHWAKILASDDVTARTILYRDKVAGSINRFRIDEMEWVGYWIGKEYWGMGIARDALRLLLKEFTARPLHARIATSNIGSRRVAEHCGFVPVETSMSEETERFPACEETLYRLD